MLDMEPGLVTRVVSFDSSDSLSNPVTPFSEGSAVSKMIGNNFRRFEWPRVASTLDVIARWVRAQAGKTYQPWQDDQLWAFVQESKSSTGPCAVWG